VRCIGPYCTVRLVAAVALAVPLVAVAVIVPVPAVVVVAAVTVTVALPPGFTLAGLKLTVTPVGAVAFNVTALVKPLVAATATVKVMVLPRTTLIEVEAGVTVNVGATTVTPSLAVAVDEPLAALTVIVPVAAADVVAAVTVAVALAPGLTLAGLKLTVTPVGAVADSVTALVNPLVAATTTVNVVV
jgi:hypothetical protein